MSETPAPTTRAARRAESESTKGLPQLVAGVVIFLASLAAFVYLETLDRDTSALVTFCGPAVAALLVIGHQARTTARQDQVLEAQTAQLTTITRQTNGVLDGRIHSGAKAAVTDALQEAGIIAAPATVQVKVLTPTADPAATQDNGLSPEQVTELTLPAQPVTELADARPTGRRR